MGVKVNQLHTHHLFFSCKFTKSGDKTLTSADERPCKRFSRHEKRLEGKVFFLILWWERLTVWENILWRNMRVPYARQVSLSDALFEKVGETPAGAMPVSEEDIEKIVQRSVCNVYDKFRYRADHMAHWVNGPTKRFAMHVVNGLRDGLRRQMREIRLYPENVELVPGIIVDILDKCYVSPGTYLGFNISSAFGQPFAQASMNVFHFAGVSKTASQGNERLKEILQVSKNVRHPSATVLYHRAVAPRSFIEAIQMSQKNLVEVTLHAVVEDYVPDHVSHWFGKGHGIFDGQFHDLDDEQVVDDGHPSWCEYYAKVEHDMSFGEWVRSLGPNCFALRLFLRPDVLIMHGLLPSDVASALNSKNGIEYRQPRSRKKVTFVAGGGSGGGNDNNNINNGMTGTSFSENEATSHVPDMEEQFMQDLNQGTGGGGGGNGGSSLEQVIQHNAISQSMDCISYYVVASPLSSASVYVLAVVQNPDLDRATAKNLANSFFMELIINRMSKIPIQPQTRSVAARPGLSAFHPANIRAAGVPGILRVFPKQIPKLEAVEGVYVERANPKRSIIVLNRHYRRHYGIYAKDIADLLCHPQGGGLARERITHCGFDEDGLYVKYLTEAKYLRNDHLEKIGDEVIEFEMTDLERTDPENHHPMSILKKRLNDEETLSEQHFEKTGHEREPSELEKMAYLYAIETDGSNLPGLLANPKVDNRRTFSNEPVQIQQYLGIDAAYRYIAYTLNELVKAVDGTHIDSRHIKLLASFMTSQGTFIRLTYWGVVQALGGGLASMTPGYLPTEIMMNAAVAKKSERANGISAAMLVNADTKAGELQRADPRYQAAIQEAMRELITTLEKSSERLKSYQNYQNGGRPADERVRRILYAFRSARNILERPEETDDAFEAQSVARHFRDRRQDDEEEARHQEQILRAFHAGAKRDRTHMSQDDEDLAYMQESLASRSSVQPRSDSNTVVENDDETSIADFYNKIESTRTMFSYVYESTEGMTD